MTKKDFISLADALRGLECVGELLVSGDGYEPIVPQYVYSRERLLAALCGWMRAKNPQFMEQRWRDYLAGRCGPNGGKVKD